MTNVSLSLPAGGNLNVGSTERWISGAGGALLALLGLTRRSGGGVALAAAGGLLLYRGLTGRCPAYARLGIGEFNPLRITRAITINRPRDEVYGFWRAMENFPRFMRHLESVRPLDGNRSHWRARGPKGLGTIEWEAEMVEERAGERLAWRSLPGSQVENSGCVTFADALHGQGTEIRVEIDYTPPAGKAKQAVAHLFNPAFSQMIQEDIRRCKQLLETGEIPTIEGQPAGRRQSFCRQESAP